MFEKALEKNLKEDESIASIVRKYPLVFFWQILISAVCSIAPFFFLLPLMRGGWWGVAIFAGFVAFGLIVAIRILIQYSFNVFVITDARIIDIDQRGFFDRTVSETTYDAIQDVSYRIRGISQTLLHYGSIIIQTAGSQANIELTGVKNPELLQQLIIRIQHEKQQERDVSAAEIAAAIKTMKLNSDESVPSSTSEDDRRTHF
ncbi:MAG: PH domain-containing protein [Patescibacteria group bacterium]|nr:PH domain-containing protein [Patescibacteria group bacterium]MDD5715157.1 PH domain-containing protein [Patescibacteria group bacterium]